MTMPYAAQRIIMKGERRNQYLWRRPYAGEGIEALVMGIKKRAA